MSDDSPQGVDKGHHPEWATEAALLRSTVVEQTETIRTLLRTMATLARREPHCVEASDQYLKQLEERLRERDRCVQERAEELDELMQELEDVEREPGRTHDGLTPPPSSPRPESESEKADTIGLEQEIAALTRRIEQAESAVTVGASCVADARERLRAVDAELRTLDEEEAVAKRLQVQVEAGAARLAESRQQIQSRDAFIRELQVLDAGLSARVNLLASAVAATATSKAVSPRRPARNPGSEKDADGVVGQVEDPSAGLQAAYAEHQALQQDNIRKFQYIAHLQEILDSKRSAMGTCKGANEEEKTGETREESEIEVPRTGGSEAPEPVSRVRPECPEIRGPTGWPRMRESPRLPLRLLDSPPRSPTRLKPEREVEVRRGPRCSDTVRRNPDGSRRSFGGSVEITGALGDRFSKECRRSSLNMPCTVVSAITASPATGTRPGVSSVLAPTCAMAQASVDVRVSRGVGAPGGVWGSVDLRSMA